MVQTVKEFWSKNPVGTNFIVGEVNKSFFESYDEFRYRTEGHILNELDQINFRNKEVLEIGTGQGSDAMQIIKRGGLYHGFDLTAESIDRLKKRFEIYNLPFQDLKVGNATSIPYPDNHFDIVYSHGVIHHSPDIEIIVNEMHRVLKSDGKAIVMLYHMNSYNYEISIKLLRRIGLIVAYYLPFLRNAISKVTGEDESRLTKHFNYFKRDGLSYLNMSNFIHRSTDGPDNVYSSVWSKKKTKLLFETFEKVKFRVHFLNERHLLWLRYLLPQSVKKSMSKLWGWHLWVFASK